MRLLFVDDDHRVLSGLRRQLHGRCPDWSADFEPGGAEALAALQRQRYDAVVSDMRMPGVDGRAVLAETARRHPRAVRMVLSGHADGPCGERLAACAHRILDKPCATDALVSELRCSVERRAALDALGDPLLDTLWCRAPGLVPGLPELLASLSGVGTPPESLAAHVLDEDRNAWKRVLSVAASVQSDQLALDAPPRRVIEVLGPQSVLAVMVGLHVQRAAGGEWTDRFARGAALAVGAHAAGRRRDFSADELADLLLAALLAPLAQGGEARWLQLSWLLAAWGISPRALASLSPQGSNGPVGKVLLAARPQLPGAVPPPAEPGPRRDPSSGLGGESGREQSILDGLRRSLPDHEPSGKEGLK